MQWRQRGVGRDPQQQPERLQLLRALHQGGQQAGDVPRCIAAPTSAPPLGSGSSHGHRGTDFTSTNAIVTTARTKVDTVPSNNSSSGEPCRRSTGSCRHSSSPSHLRWKLLRRWRCCCSQGGLRLLCPHLLICLRLAPPPRVVLVQLVAAGAARPLEGGQVVEAPALLAEALQAAILDDRGEGGEVY